VAKFRYALEYRATFFDFDQVKAQQLADRWMRDSSVDNPFQESKAVMGFENLWRNDAVGLGAHYAPRGWIVSV
jgi:hypothetical protein